MAVKYTWKNQNFRVPADTVGTIIEQIEQREGVCHPAKLVDAARPISSPIHELMEWDDQSAAESYRVEQARGIIQSIRFLGDDGVMSDAPAFVHVRLEGGGPGYMNIAKVASDADLRQQMLDDALKALISWEVRFRALDEFTPIVNAIRQVQQTIKTARQKVAVKK